MSCVERSRHRVRGNLCDEHPSGNIWSAIAHWESVKLDPEHSWYGTYQRFACQAACEAWRRSG